MDLKRYCPSRTTLKPKTPESKKSGQGYRRLAGHAQRLVLFLAGLRYCLRAPCVRLEHLERLARSAEKHGGEHMRPYDVAKAMVGGLLGTLLQTIMA